jgi:hypothetical protein
LVCGDGIGGGQEFPLGARQIFSDGLKRGHGL